MLFQFTLIFFGSSGMAYAINNFADTNCGLHRTSRTGKVVGGHDAIPGEYPWLVSITRRGGHFCGGSVLNNKFILTAGHCMCSSGTKYVQPESIRVMLGQHDLGKQETPNSYEMRVNAITLHPSYKCSKASHDLAILELVQVIQWSVNVAPACFPPSVGESDYNKFDNSLATVAGWGWLTEKSTQGSKATVLQKASVNVIETETCQQWYKSQGKKTKIHESQICAGHEQGGIDACWADSGGPLMVENENQIIVVGVVSTGIGCARPYLPGLYTRISDYIPWIRSIVTSK